jgi:hypothetical protein
MPKVVVDVSELRSKSGDDAVKDLKEFLGEKLDAEIDISADLLSLSFDEEKGHVPSRSFLRVLLKKFLHKTDLKEDFRVIAGKENALMFKEREVVEVEE